jgi:hypothetical protein
MIEDILKTIKHKKEENEVKPHGTQIKESTSSSSRYNQEVREGIAQIFDIKLSPSYKLGYDHGSNDGYYTSSEREDYILQYSPKDAVVKAEYELGYKEGYQEGVWDW